MEGHNFGLSAAVLSFNRGTQLLATVARRFFGVAVAAYFDNFCVVEPEFAGRSGKRVVHTLASWMGWQFSKKKNIPMRVDNPFLGVIADFTRRFHREGEVILRLKPERVKRLVEYTNRRSGMTSFQRPRRTRWRASSTSCRSRAALVG
jgi:hypothetical protein